MFKLWATIQKDIRILLRDRVGLTLMFLMPVVLAIVITMVQNGTFEMVNDNKVPIIIQNLDTQAPSKELVKAIEKTGSFDIKKTGTITDEESLKKTMRDEDVMLALVIPANYSDDVNARSKSVGQKALKTIVERDSTIKDKDSLAPLKLYYNPVLQQSFRKGINGALSSALQIVQSKYIVKELYHEINNEEIPDSVEAQIVGQQTSIHETPVSRDGNRNIPNATQHNVPAWTIFAMFFIVISLGSSIVREKRSGSYIRLRTLPTHFGLAMISKQITYVGIAFLQAVLIFTLGILLFPKLGLPALVLPHDIIGLLLVTFICGLCATSFAICIGVFANTQEQANGFGAVSIVLLAAIGGLLVPSFAIPASLQFFMKLSPLHWCLEAYYGLFLEGGRLQDIMVNIIPLLLITLFFQVLAWYGLKKKGLI